MFGVGKGADFGLDGDLITVGERANIGAHAWIRGKGRLIMGEDIMMGEFVTIYTQDHHIDGSGFDGFVVGDVTIGNNVWIGGHAIILKGITVGDRAVIGAGSVVTKDVEDGETVVGIPAKSLKKRR